MLRLKFDCLKNNRFGVGSWVWIYKTKEGDISRGEYCMAKNIGFEGSPLLPENYSIINIPVDENTSYSAIVKFPDGSVRTFSGIKPGKTFLIHDLPAFGRLSATFNLYLRFAFNRANGFVELLQIFLLAGIIYWLLNKFNRIKDIKPKIKISLAVIIGLLYFSFFIFHGFRPYTENYWLEFSLFPFVFFVVPFLSDLLLDKYQTQRISHYKILELIGEGGMGKVYKAKDSTQNRIVALKIMHPGLTDNEEGLKRFQRESEIGARLKHKYIVNIYEAGVWNDQCFLVMEYLKGKTLRSIIKTEGKFDPQRLISVCLPVARALKEIHGHNIVHRDIKTENIFITRENKIKLMDFGLAKSAIFTVVTRTNILLGTLAYMSPQQAVGETIDHRSDIYSLGVIMYELATGFLPFKGSHDMALIFEIFKNQPRPIRNFVKNFPHSLEKCIFKAMAKETEDRFQNVDELIKQLELIDKEISKNEHERIT